MRGILRLAQANPKTAVLVAVFFTSFSSILIRLSDAPPFAIAAYRMAITTALTWPLALRAPKAERRPVRGSGLWLSVLGGILLALHFATWITSLSYTSVASSTVLVTTHPIFVLALGYVVLGERVPMRSLAFVFVALAGSVVLSIGDAQLGGHVLLGDALALAGAIFVAGYMLIGRFVRRQVPALQYTLLVYGVATVVLIGLCLVTRVSLFPYPPHELAIFAVLAIVCTMLGHTVFNWALKFVQTSFVSTSILGEPVYASVLALLLFGELPGTLTLVGGAIVIVGLYAFVRSEARRA